MFAASVVAGIAVTVMTGDVAIGCGVAAVVVAAIL
jgi:hypothetical protein